MSPVLRIIGALAVLGAAALAPGCVSARPEAFDSPDAAASALAVAIRDGSDARLLEIFGPEAEDLVSSGDEVADRNLRQSFLELYDQQHALEREEPWTATLVVGPDDWPFPLPLVQDDDGRWSFDVEAGREEIIDRRVGRNELATIETCRAVVDAQRDYAAMQWPGKPPGEYAQRFLSAAGPESGQRDGLYWPTAEGEPPSPLGELVADAQAEGYALAGERAGPQPLHGYLYRMLTAQGPAAPGGRASYLVGGRLTRGFAVVAYPVEYGNSGVMTFLVGANGIVYEADLGEDTARAAVAMTEYDPDARWSPCD